MMINGFTEHIATHKKKLSLDDIEPLLIRTGRLRQREREHKEHNFEHRKAQIIVSTFSR